MEGILSGFRFSSKKAAKASQTTAVKPVVATQNTVPNPSNSKGEISQDSAENTTNHRSPAMRLTKNNPTKPIDDDFDIPSDPVMPSYANPSSSMSMSKPLSNTSNTPSAVIGPKISFKGELTGEEDLLIQGRVEGTIDLKNNHLTVGAQGVVKANLMAKTITIEGTVEGDLIGQERIEIKSSSNVKGNLVAARVTLEDGAKFRGSIDMDSSSGSSLSSGKHSSSGSSSSSSSSNSFSSTATGSPADKVEKA